MKIWLIFLIIITFRLYHQSIKSLHSADQADSIESLPYEIQSSILRTNTKNFHPDFIAYLREETRDDILHMIPNKQLVNLIKYLDLDDAVEILGDFETKELVQILSKLGSQQRERIEESLQYDENSAGRLMNRDYLSIKSNLTVGELIDQLRNSRRGPTGSGFASISACQSGLCASARNAM